MATAPEAAPVPAPAAPLDMSKVTTAYLKIRDHRSELKKAFTTQDDDLKGKQEQLEAVMLKHLLASGMESVRTQTGTFYKKEEIKPSCQDWNAFYKWVADNNAFEALEKRLTKTFIADFMAEHEGACPPGVSVYRENVVIVRRPS